MHHLGSTRSANGRDHLLQTPDSFVRTFLPGLTGGMAVLHAAPQRGAGFAMMTVEFEAGGSLAGGGSAQRFLYVLEGSLHLAHAASPYELLREGGFAYLPADTLHAVAARTPARAVVIEKNFEPVPSAPPPARDPEPPTFLMGNEGERSAAALNGDGGVLVRQLLPASPAFDFAVNTMTYAPGASLGQVEVHSMEHGLLMLEGGGIYRLGDRWYPVEAGDFIWMGPFCPQWFGCIGKTPARYLIYKNCNRNVLG